MIFIIGKNDTLKTETNFGWKYLYFCFSYAAISRDGVPISIDNVDIKICLTTSQWGPYITVMNDGVLRALLINPQAFRPPFGGRCCMWITSF